jgi:hypothetical protein
MSQDTAMAKAEDLKRVLLDHGVPEVRIELMQGRPVPNGADRWDSLKIVANFAHHIVSRRGKHPTPGLAGIKKGRPAVPATPGHKAQEALPGPLANGYGGWDLCYRIITFGYANHPGKGGPIVVNGFKIPKDSARRYTWGTEWEGGVRESDWDTVLTNPRTGDRMTMREFMGRSHAAIQAYFELPAEAHLEHKTWAPKRKIDRLNYTRASGIEEIRRFTKARGDRVMAAAVEEDDVRPDDVVGFEIDSKTGRFKTDAKGDRVPITLQVFVTRMNWLYQQVLEGGKVDAQLDRIETKVNRPH